jgi:hypothetical protein
MLVDVDTYLLAVIGTILLGAFLTAILPEGKTSGIVRAMTRLVCLLVIISPVLNFLNTENEKTEKNFAKTVIQTDESFIQYYSELRVQNAETAIETQLLQSFETACKVSICWELKNDEIHVQKIVLTVDKNCNEEVKARMCEYVTQNYCSEVLLE